MNRETEALVRQARDGDLRAFEELVREFQDVVVAYATSVLRDSGLAEDAAQEAFLDVWQLLPTLREPAAFVSWLRRIVFKHCDRIMRRRRRPRSGIEAALDVASSDPSPQDSLEAAEDREALGRAIADLTQAEQDVVLLYYMGERSQTEVAEFLGITSNAVKTRLYAARRRLRAHLTRVEVGLDAARPSANEEFMVKVSRLIQPDALKEERPWMWSPGIGTDVWAMFRACVLGDLEAVRRLVDRDPSLVRAHYEYRTALSFAVCADRLDVAEYLVDHGALDSGLGDPVQMARDRGHSAMVELLERKMRELYGASAEGELVAEAIRSRSLPELRRLLDERPSLLRAGDRRSNEPIHWAVMTRRIDVIDELVRRGADLDVRRGDGALPIHLTNGDYFFRGWRDVLPGVTASPEDVYHHLVGLGAEVDLNMAAFSGDESRVRELLARDSSLVNQPSSYRSYYVGCGAALKDAVLGGDLKMVELLLDRGADPNLPEEGIAPEGHALYAAVQQGRYDIAQLLLEHGAHPNPRVESSADAVWTAIRRGDRRMLDLLGSFDAEMDTPIPLDGALAYEDLVASGVRLPLKILAFYGDVAAVRRLLEHDPDRASEPEPLELAAKRGHEEIVRLLLRHGPATAREVTVSKPREMALLLFEHGMQPNRPDWLRATPLHHFAANGDIESAAVFLDHGADLTARDEEHESTPLAWAAREGQRRMVEYLLRRGAPTELPDDPPWATPLAWATRRGHDEIVRILTEYQRSGIPPKRSVAEIEALVRDLVEAYGGDEAALVRTIRVFGLARPLEWDRPTPEVRLIRFRKAVREEARRPPGAEAEQDELTVADARRLIARLEGFATWEDLFAAHAEG